MLFCVVARSLLGLPGSAGLEYKSGTRTCTSRYHGIHTYVYVHVYLLSRYVYGTRVLEYYNGTKYCQPTGRSSHSTTYYEPRSSCKS
jgi:hypothetical protein